MTIHFNLLLLLLIFFCIALPTQLLAQGTQAQVIDESSIDIEEVLTNNPDFNSDENFIVDHKLQAAALLCLQNDLWNKIHCNKLSFQNFTRNNKDKIKSFQVTATPTHLDTLRGLLLTLGINKIFSQLRKSKKAQCAFSQHHQIKDKLDDFMGEVRQFVLDTDLPPCKQVCLINCLTNRLMIYDEGSSLDSSINGYYHRNAVNIIRRGGGMCRQFSKVAKYLTNLLDPKLKPEIMLSWDHAFMSYNFSFYPNSTKETYFTEPQTDPVNSRRCNFFTNERNEEN